MIRIRMKAGGTSTARWRIDRWGMLVLFAVQCWNMWLLLSTLLPTNWALKHVCLTLLLPALRWHMLQAMAKSFKLQYGALYQVVDEQSPLQLPSGPLKLWQFNSNSKSWKVRGIAAGGLAAGCGKCKECKVWHIAKCGWPMVALLYLVDCLHLCRAITSRSSCLSLGRTGSAGSS